MRTSALHIDDYRDFLASVYEGKKARNPEYSLRAFARTLGISPAQLSKILSRKQPLSTKHALLIAERLGLSPVERSALLKSLVGDGGERAGGTAGADWGVLADDRFRLIGDWYHFAILSLGSVEGNRHAPQWIAERLGITERVAEEAFARLLRLELVERVGRGYRQTSGPVMTTTDVPSAAIRKYHRQTLELAVDRLETTPVEEREYTSITVAIDPRKIAAVKTAMRDFKHAVAEALATGTKTKVYTLALQFFPVTTR